MFLSSEVLALSSDAESQVEISADNLTLDQKNMTSVFTGNVEARRGSMLIKAQTAHVSEDKYGFQTIELQGDPVSFTQMGEDGDKIEAQGNRFNYSTKDNLAVLAGRARVKKRDVMATGDKITYNTKTEIYTASAASANGVNEKKTGRVTVILPPDDKKKSILPVGNK